MLNRGTDQIRAEISACRRSISTTAALQFPRERHDAVRRRRARRGPHGGGPRSGMGADGASAPFQPLGGRRRSGIAPATGGAGTGVRFSSEAVPRSRRPGLRSSKPLTGSEKVTVIENGPGDRFTGGAGDGHRWSRDVRDESRTGGPPRSDCIRLNLPLQEGGLAA